jgi:hypothetical protein
MGDSRHVVLWPCAISVRRAEITPLYIDRTTLAYTVASIYFHSGWWTGLVLVVLVYGGGVHLDADTLMVFMWGNSVLSAKVYNLYT